MNTTKALSIFLPTCLLAVIACHSSRSLSYGDNKVYNDDSAIEMKSVERKTKIPFDTTTPLPQRSTMPQKMKVEFAE